MEPMEEILLQLLETAVEMFIVCMKSIDLCGGGAYMPEYRRYISMYIGFGCFSLQILWVPEPAEPPEASAGSAGNRLFLQVGGELLLGVKHLRVPLE